MKAALIRPRRIPPIPATTIMTNRTISSQPTIPLPEPSRPPLWAGREPGHSLSQPGHGIPKTLLEKRRSDKRRYPPIVNTLRRYRPTDGQGRMRPPRRTLRLPSQTAPLEARDR